MVMIPFFVADRQMSLQILKGLPLLSYPNVRMGIMANANTSKNFQRAFKEYPCDNLQRCDAIGGKPCIFPDNQNQCLTRKYILEQTIKMCDSGAFSKEGVMLSYEQLFSTYAQMDTEYGIMIDVLWDAEKTIQSAKKAKKVYQKYKDNFKLIVVAQGKTMEEYIDCYHELKNLGFEHIAIGGLLRRTQNTVRYVSVRSESFLFDVLQLIREQYPNDWMFALGCLKSQRIEKLQELDVWADSKGWIFKYKKRNKTLSDRLQLLDSEWLTIEHSNQSFHINELKQLIYTRVEYIKKQNLLFKNLHDNKNLLRKSLSSLYSDLSKKNVKLANKIAKLTTRGLLTNSEKKMIITVSKKIDKETQSQSLKIPEISDRTRQYHEQISELEIKVNDLNQNIIDIAHKIMNSKTKISDNVKNICSQIAKVTSSSEQEHRLEQVRSHIISKIFELL